MPLKKKQPLNIVRLTLTILSAFLHFLCIKVHLEKEMMQKHLSN